MSKDAPPPPANRGEHYSYAAYADPRMAETFDNARFSGPIGRLIAETQEELIAGFLAPIEGASILDVGTGTGRAAIALAKRGGVVTGVDASAEMLAVARRRAAASGATVTFVQGDAHGLLQGDQSFDAVVCLRVLMHTPDWRRSLAELCRVARTRVVIDYPALSSAAAVQALTRRIAQKLGQRVEAYRVFSHRAVRAAFETNGFRLAETHKQFVLPIVLHKKLASAAATERVEGALATLGLRRAFGSPVTLVAHRIGTPQQAWARSSSDPLRSETPSRMDAPLACT